MKLRENMYTSDTPHGEMVIKPMNCPGCMLYYKTKSHSYRELPLRIAEVGHVHRYEPSGAINGLLRVRSFHQDDAHHFMTPDQIQSEILVVLKLADEIYTTFGLKYSLELSTRPKKSIGTDEDWEIATNGLREALDEWGKPYRTNEGDGAFYGPKIDFHIHDAIGRAWQCGTIQLDMSLPERFELEYMTPSGELKRPIMIHRALYGSLERFLGVLVEHFAGRFPFWLSPRPIRILTVAEPHIDYAKTLRKKLRAAGFRVELDTSGDSVGKKVRGAQVEQVNYMLTIGDKELEGNTITIRTRDGKIMSDYKVEEFINTIQKEAQERALTSPYSEES